MKRIETIYIDLGSEKLPFRFSVLSFIKFAEQFDTEVTAIKSLEESVNYFYCAYSAACQYEKLSQDYDLDGFWNLIEEYPELVQELTTKLTESTGSKKK